MSYICAFLLFLVFEAPVGNLEKLVFMTSSKKLLPDTATAAEKVKSIECNERPSNGAMSEQVDTVFKHRKERQTPNTSFPEANGNKSYL